MTTQRVLRTFVFGAAALAAAHLAGAQTPAADRPMVGEMRTFAVAPGNGAALADLHRSGWLEARGQLLSVAEFPDLYKAVGREWTSGGVSQDRFAIPLLADERSGGEPIDPFGVLGGDAITSGLPAQPWVQSARLSHWIYVGRDVSQSSVSTMAKR